MVLKFIRSLFYVCLFLVGIVNPVISSDLSIPNSFSSGSATSASQMNANFEAVESAVDDNHTRITALETNTAPVFQGFSSSSVLGNAGLIAWQSACNSSFTGSKVCTTQEFANSRHNSSAANVSGTAWILPTLISSGTSNAAVEFYIGETNAPNQNFTCQGYVQSGYEATKVNNLGQFGREACSGSNKVACCK